RGISVPKVSWMVAAAQQQDLRPGLRSSFDRTPGLTGSYRCSIYGLGVVANSTIPGVPASTIASEDIHISFGSLPAWLHEVSNTQVETSYIADYKSACGEPMLRVFRVLDGKYYRFCYADETEFVIDNEGTEVWAAWREPLTIEDTATYLLGPVLGFVM